MKNLQPTRILFYFMLLVTGFAYAQPAINNNPSQYIVCDDNSNNGIATFNVSTKNVEILNGLNPSNYSIAYYLTLNDPINGVFADQIPFNNYTSGNDYVYAKVWENINPSNFAYTGFNIIVNHKPITPIIGSVIHPTCSVSTGSFVISNFNGIYNYTFNPNTVTISGSGNITANQPGTYQVTANFEGCSSDLGYVTINPQPAGIPVPTALITQQPNCTIPYGQITFTSPTSTIYEYSINDGETFQSSHIFNNLLVGTYNLRYRLITQPNCISPSISLTIDGSSLPNAIVSGAGEYCYGNDATILFTGSNGVAPYTFTYTVNGGSNLTIVSSGDIASLNFESPEVNNIGYTMTIKLVSIQDSSSTSCSQVLNTISTLNFIRNLNLYPFTNINISDSSPYDGVAVVNLNNSHFVPQNSYLNLNFFTSLQDAENNVNSISNPATYTNLTPTQTIYVRTSDTFSSCYVINSFLINIYDAGAIVPIPNIYFKSIVLDNYDFNNDSEIQVFEGLQIKNLNFQPNSNITSLEGINYFTNLERLEIFEGIIEMTTLNLENLPNLNFIEFYGTNGSIGSLNLINLPSLKYFYNVTPFFIIGSINLSGLASIEEFYVFETSTPTFNINSFITLKKVIISGSALTSIDISNLSNLEEFEIKGTQITSMDFTGLTNLKRLECIYNSSLTSIDLAGLSNLEKLDCSYNHLSSLDLNDLISLDWLICNNNQLTSLNTNASSINCSYNQLTTLELDSPFSYLDCSYNLLTSLDLRNFSLGDEVYLSYNNLTHLFAKNGFGNQYFIIQLEGNTNLQYVCCDEYSDDDPDMNTILNELFFTLGNTTCVVNSYCSFTPGGNFNTISGNVKYDTDNNGCDANDLAQPSIRVNINDGTNTGASFTNTTGDYKFYTQAGSFDITPEIENPSFFNFTPTTATIPFTDNNNNTATQDFCFSANGVHPDLEVVLAPITPARPGFDATYKLVYKNKGNQTLNGVLSLNYDVFRLLFISSNTTPDFNFEGTIDWNFTNLLPFESRSISLTLNVNSPLETPAVNIGDVLNFVATINPISGDELPDDNTFALVQTVVGSYDPNDITCLEGNNVAPSEIGEYLHYAINFENTGNYPAENVVVKTIVDTTKFDVNSLQLLNTSNPVDARITGNVVEFIFENIQLGGPGGHGHILLKIKSKNTLVSGDAVAKNANIYFDYNAPVDTGMATTVFQSLSNTVFEKDDSINVSPNPTNSKININSNFNIKKVELYDVQGRVLETQIGETETFDISEKANGIYFLKITTEKGSKVEKVIKE